VGESKNKTTYAMSRRRLNTIIVVCLLAAAVFIWFDHSPASRKLQRHVESENQVINYDFQKYHGKTFTVANVVDGDTIDIDIPDGNSLTTRIRLWGIDTPESKHPQKGVCYFGPQAAEFTTTTALGKQVTVYLEKHSTRCRYGRLLAYVQLPDSKFLNEVLLSEGFAYAELRFRHSFYQRYKQLEASARSRSEGLWENVTHEQLPEWLQRRKPTLMQKK
jgi:endonuclease YncB( thermonuclease family)